MYIHDTMYTYMLTLITCSIHVSTLWYNYMYDLRTIEGHVHVQLTQNVQQNSKCIVQHINYMYMYIAQVLSPSMVHHLLEQCAREQRLS